ncbi:MAG TPA: LD-carboxypeptidase, partial [Actinomycetota bacterium]
MGGPHHVTHVAATLFGPPLPPGGTIGVCAPSGPYYNRSDIERPVEWWEERGFRVKLTEGVWAQDDYVAGAPEQRAADLNALFADPEVDVIQVLWGGTGAMQVLPHIDYDLIAANPKALMGFSDITNLHIAIRQRTGLATLHGPGLGSMGIPERTAFTWDSALDAFMKGAAGQVPRDPDDAYVRAIA